MKRLCVLILVVLSLGAVWSFSKRMTSDSPESVSLPEIRVEGLHPLVKTTIEKAVERVNEQPGFAQAWGELGMVLVAHDFPEAARTCLNEAAKLDPQEFRWSYYAGYSQVAFDFETALEHFDQALKLNPDYIPLRLRIAQILMQLGEIDRCAELLEAGRKRDPDNPYILVTQGRLALLQNQTEFAQDLFERAARLEGWMPRSAYQELVKLSNRKGDVERTLEYQRMLDKLPQVARLEFPDPILEQIRKLEGLSKSEAERADLALASGDFVTAISIYESLIRRRADLPTAHVNLAQAYAMSGRFQDAIAAYQQVLDKFGKNLPARMGLAASYERSGNFPAAIDQYRQVIEEKPDHKQAWFFLGMIHERQGRSDEAIRCYRESTKIDPSYPQAQLALGVALMQQKRFEEARTHIQRAVDLVPGDPTPAGFLEQVENLLKTSQQ